MSQYDQAQPQVAVSYPPPAQGGAYTAPAPPAGYPTNDGNYAQNPAPAETQSRGDGFWKGCCAALCCCCALDVCF